jgi:hypothetical protein
MSKPILFDDKIHKAMFIWPEANKSFPHRGGNKKEGGNDVKPLAETVAHMKSRLRRPKFSSRLVFS